MNKKSQALHIIAKHLRMKKQAAVGTDIGLGELGNLATLGYGGYAAPMGSLHAAFAHTPNVEEIQGMDKEKALALIPGVATSRTIRRRLAQHKLLKKNKDSWDVPSVFNEHIAPLSNMALMTALGAPIGAALSGTMGTNKLDGTIIGAAAGAGVSGLSSLAGSIAALCKKRRTMEEQAYVENSPRHKTLIHLIPGYGAYNDWKSIGATRNLSDDTPDNVREKAEKAKEKYKNESESED